MSGSPAGWSNRRPRDCSRPRLAENSNGSASDSKVTSRRQRGRLFYVYTRDGIGIARQQLRHCDVRHLAGRVIATPRPQDLVAEARKVGHRTPHAGEVARTRHDDAHATIDGSRACGDDRAEDAEALRIHLRLSLEAARRARLRPACAATGGSAAKPVFRRYRAKSRSHTSFPRLRPTQKTRAGNCPGPSGTPRGPPRGFRRPTARLPARRSPRHRTGLSGTVSR